MIVKLLKVFLVEKSSNLLFLEKISPSPLKLFNIFQANPLYILLVFIIVIIINIFQLLNLFYIYFIFIILHFNNYILVFLRFIISNFIRYNAYLLYLYLIGYFSIYVNFFIGQLPKKNIIGVIAQLIFNLINRNLKLFYIL